MLEQINAILPVTRQLPILVTAPNFNSVRNSCTGRRNSFGTPSLEIYSRPLRSTCPAAEIRFRFFRVPEHFGPPSAAPPQTSTNQRPGACFSPRLLSYLLPAPPPFATPLEPHHTQRLAQQCDMTKRSIHEHADTPVAPASPLLDDRRLPPPSRNLHPPPLYTCHKPQTRGAFSSFHAYTRRLQAQQRLGRVAAQIPESIGPRRSRRPLP